MSSDIDLSSDDLDSQLLTMQGLQPDRPYYYYLTQANLIDLIIITILLKQ